MKTKVKVYKKGRHSYGFLMINKTDSF